MTHLENREIETWDDGDKLSFALAGLALVTAQAQKENFGPIRGWTDDYPDRLLEKIDFWVSHIRAIRDGEEL